MKITVIVIVIIVLLLSLFIFFGVEKQPSPEIVSSKSLDISSIPDNVEITFKQEIHMNFFEFVHIEMDSKDIREFIDKNSRLGAADSSKETINFDTYLTRFSWFEPQKLTEKLYRNNKGADEEWKWQSHIMYGPKSSSPDRTVLYIVYFEEK